jgi:hypothetical protein
MASPTLPEEFKEFLRLLNAHKVEYLLIGGYAVGIHGYPRTTADIDIWVGISPDTASRLVKVFHAFGMRDASITTDLFQQPGTIIRMGLPPMRIEVLNQIDGVDFAAGYPDGCVMELDGIPVRVISLAHLRANKKASGRYKDLADLEQLPES